MPNLSDSGRFRNIAKASAALVVEKMIAHLHCGDEQVRQAVVINIAEGCSDTDQPVHRHSRSARDIFKTAISQIPPEFIAARLIHKKQISSTISVHISGRDRCSMVIMIRFELLPSLFHYL